MTRDAASIDAGTRAALARAGPLSHRVGVTAGLVRRLPAGMEVEPDAEDERGEGHVPAA
jgi:hypothetical protein